jgi:hypothetical protein
MHEEAMTITEAIRAVSDEYDGDVAQAAANAGFARLMKAETCREYGEIDEELPSYVEEIARGMGVKPGTILPSYVYTACRMAFRMGMRTQRKLERPDEKTSVFWRGTQAS